MSTTTHECSSSNNVSREDLEAGVQTSLKKASAKLNKDIQTDHKTFTANKHTGIKAGQFTKSKHTSTQASNKKNVTQSVQTDDGGWQKVGANKNKHHNVIAKKSKEEFSLRDDNPFKVLGEQNNTSANIEFFETVEEREKSVSQESIRCRCCHI